MMSILSDPLKPIQLRELLKTDVSYKLKTTIFELPQKAKKNEYSILCMCTSRSTYMICRGNLPNDLIPRLNRRTTTSQRVVGYRPTILFLPDRASRLKDIYPMSFKQKENCRPGRAIALTRRHVGDWF